MTVKIGIRLKEAREKRGLKKAEVARRMGLTRGAIDQHESGDSGLSVDTLRDYIKLYRITADWTLFGRGKGPNDARDPREAFLETVDQIPESQHPTALRSLQAFIPPEKDTA